MHTEGKQCLGHSSDPLGASSILLCLKWRLSTLATMYIALFFYPTLERQKVLPPFSQVLTSTKKKVKLQLVVT